MGPTAYRYSRVSLSQSLLHLCGGCYPISPTNKLRHRDVDTPTSYHWPVAELGREHLPSLSGRCSSSSPAAASLKRAPCALWESSPTSAQRGGLTRRSGVLAQSTTAWPATHSWPPSHPPWERTRSQSFQLGRQHGHTFTLKIYLDYKIIGAPNPLPTTPL